MILQKMSDDVEIVQSLSTYPNQEDGLSAEELKAKFDQGPKALKNYLNNVLVPAVQEIQKALAAGEQYGLDTTLQVAGRAADAAAVGTALAGKAPAGFLSKSYSVSTEQDIDQLLLDELQTMGTNTIRFLVINPESADVLYGCGTYCELYFRSNGYATAIFTTYGNSAVQRLYKNCNAWAWSPFEYETPDMLVGVEYRTTERRNGKAVYSQMIDFGALPNTDVASVAFSGQAVNLVDIQATVWSGTEAMNLPAYLSGYLAAYAYATESSVAIRTTTDMTSYSCKAIVKYTKD